MNYGLIGNPLGHSFSKEVHELMGYEYTLKELIPEQLEGFITEKDFLGINVTIPYKEKVIPYLDYFDESAKKIGACNTIVNKNGELWGYNTDYFGAKALFERQKIPVRRKKALILGTGGTAKTFYRVLKDLQADEVKLVSRHPDSGQISYDEAYSQCKDFDIIVNTTPVGMFPKTSDSPIDLSKFENLCLVVDAIYNPLKTRLIIDAEQRDIKAEGGLYMLIAQAIYSSQLFGKINPEKELTEKIFNSILKKKRNIVLIGMPGCGKSTIGKLLDENFIDTDYEIEKTFGASPCELIEKYGEACFREKEAAVIEKASSCNGRVIATGGGAILKHENVIRLKQNGILIYLNVPLKKLTPTEDRPLSNSPQALEKLFKERSEIYKAVCDIEIESDFDIGETLRKIRKVTDYEITHY